MNVAEAIAALKQIEGARGIAAELESEVARIEKARYDAVGSEQKRGRELREMQDTLNEIVESVGVDGEDSKAKAKNLTAKLKKTAEERDALQQQLTDLQTAKQELEVARTESDRLLAVERRRLTIRDAAAAVRANPTVLETILSLEGNRELALEVAPQEDGSKQVLVVRGDERKPLRDFAATTLPDFLPSLFPADAPPTPPTAPRDPRLPGGTPNSKPKDQPSLTASVLKSAGFTGLPE